MTPGKSVAGRAARHGATPRPFGRLLSAAWTFLVLLALTPNAWAATDCAGLSRQLERLSAARATDLKAGVDGRSFKDLYNDCDRNDRFAGKSLPSFRGRPLKCSTDKNRVEFVRRYPDNTIVFRSKMAVDADGAPLSHGAGRSATDQPVTWLTFDHGSDARYVNAEKVSFAVVPINAPTGGISFQAASGVKKGDLAAIFANGRCSFGVVGDAGPYFRLGEGSLKAHADLGNPQCQIAGENPCRKLKHGGSGQSIASGVTFLLFPSTRPAPLLSQTVSAVAEDAAKARVQAFLDAHATGSE